MTSLITPKGYFSLTHRQCMSLLRTETVRDIKGSEVVFWDGKRMLCSKTPANQMRLARIRKHADNVRMGDAFLDWKTVGHSPAGKWRLEG